jgi:hypothetical protein
MKYLLAFLLTVVSMISGKSQSNSINLLSVEYAFWALAPTNVNLISYYTRAEENELTEASGFSNQFSLNYSRINKDGFCFQLKFAYRNSTVSYEDSSIVGYKLERDPFFGFVLAPESVYISRSNRQEILLSAGVLYIKKISRQKPLEVQIPISLGMGFHLAAQDDVYDQEGNQQRLSNFEFNQGLSCFLESAPALSYYPKRRYRGRGFGFTIGVPLGLRLVNASRSLEGMIGLSTGVQFSF